MNKVFNLENPWMKFLGKVFDLMMINLITLLLMIPIVTIGPAITAMFYSLNRIIKGQDTNLLSEHLTFFRRNIKGPMIVTLLHFSLLLGLFAYLTLLGKSTANSIIALKVMIYVLMAFSTLLAIYAYGLFASFNNHVFVTIKNSFFLMIAYIPRTILIGAIYIGFSLFFFRFLAVFAPIVFLLGLVLPSLLVVLLLKSVFATTIEKTEA